MRICVYGLGHLGVVTSACLASLGHDVCGLDDDPVNIDALNQAVMPVFEPGLQNLIQTGIAQRRLRFTTQKTEAVAGVPILWVAFDTPVDEADRADIAFVSGKIKSVLPVLENGSLIVVSTQMPVGSIRKLEAFAKQEFDDKSLRFACCPENLRLGNAVDLFLHPDRIVAGARTAEDITLLTELLTSISTSIEWMSVESAEMTKHAINAFLGMSIAFTNEIASICELAGADAREVERGLRSEARIGRQAYVAPGGAFAGGTLARDIEYLNAKAARHKLATPLLAAVTQSNNAHKSWIRRNLLLQFESLAGREVVVWGLTYKPGTDSLRRSAAVELCDWLLAQQARLSVYDPVAKALPEHWHRKVTRCAAPLDAIGAAAALVIGCDWPEFKRVAEDLPRHARPGLAVFDANRHLKEIVPAMGFTYVAVGTMPAKRAV